MMHYYTLLIGIKLEDKNIRETFIEVEEVVKEVNTTFNKASNEEDGEGDKKYQWFIISLMRYIVGTFE